MGFAKLGAGVAAIAGLGFVPTGNGKRVFDYYLSGIRTLEEYSPGRVFRTFQASHMLSGLESASRDARFISSSSISALKQTAEGARWLEYINKLTGQQVDIGRIAKEGFRFEGGQLLIGTSGSEVLLKHAQILRSPAGASPSFQSAYARSLFGGPLSSKFEAERVSKNFSRFEVDSAIKTFGQKIPFTSPSGKEAAETFMFVGGQTKVEAAKRFVFGYGTSLIERMNQLARSPFEMEPFASIMKHVPGINRIGFDVVPSSGLKTLAKLTGKLGLATTATMLGYRELDHIFRESSLLDNTILAEGITAGIGTASTRFQVGLSKAAEATGLHDYRERQETIAPGSTSLQKLLAFPIMGAIGFTGFDYLQRVKDLAQLRINYGIPSQDAAAFTDLKNKLFLNTIYGKETPIEEIQRVKELSQKGFSKIQADVDGLVVGWRGKIASNIAKAQSRHPILNLLGQVGHKKVGVLAGIAAGTALIAPFIPGALIPSTRPEELEDIYSGKKEVVIKKGRFWEFGRSKFEGEGVDKFRAHWYPRMLARAKEKSLYGENISPMKRFYLENFTYELEKQHYYDRPYPITGVGLQDIPILGPILSATIGKLIKPAALMHTDEWMAKTGTSQDVVDYKTIYGGIETRYRDEDDPKHRLPPDAVKRMAPGYKYQKAPGELEPGVPISPFSTKGVIGEQAYRLAEAIGLPGFIMSSIKEAVTGSPDVFDQEMQLESANRMYGAERELWDKDIGGALGTSELLRRLYPHRRRQIELYNPIRNQMPDTWLPGPGDKSFDFLHGDPFAKISEGESRLPGVGYAALHPELEGVDPRDYPAIHRLKILSDIAPYSEKYGQALGNVREIRGTPSWTNQEEEMFQTIMEQIRAKKNKKEFAEYKYRTPARTEIGEILARANEAAKQEEGPGWFERTIGSYWETLAHNAETPLEYLTPISPAAKLINMRTAVEDYKKTQVYGTQNAFWQSPIRDFLSPFVESTKHAFGWDGIPQSVKEKRQIDEYFDLLKYVKYTGLERQAVIQKDLESAKDFGSKRRETLFGINPYTFNFTHIFRSLPRSEKDYLNAFIAADLEERKEILNLVPENEQALLLARWQIEDANEAQKAIDKGLLNEEQLARANKQIEELYEDKETEGFSKDKELWAEYLVTRQSEESYPDWYRRTKLLAQKAQELGLPIPGADWVGFSPSIDLDDIKLKVVENLGKNIHDFNLWKDRQRLVGRRPIIQQTVEDLEGYGNPKEQDILDIRSKISNILSGNKLRTSIVDISPGMGIGGDKITIEIQEDRNKELREKIRRGDLFDN